MMIDKISVIIPVYNVEKYLSACLDSVLAQTYAELEILAVNDGSTDGSAKILEEYAERDSRIQVLNKPNGGLSDARNYGIEHATGQYYLFIDSDDLIRPDMADLLYRALIQYDADIAVSDMEYFYEDGVFYVINKKNRYEVIVPPAGALVSELPDDYDTIVLNGVEYYKVDDTVYRLVLVDGVPALEVLGQMYGSMAKKYNYYY